MKDHPTQRSNPESTLVEWLRRFDIAVVLPCFNVQDQINGVLRGIPRYVTHVLVIDDASTDGTGSIVQKVAEDDPRIVMVRHPFNQGVGAAMVTGFRKALDLGAQIVAKMDGDGQMSPNNLPELLLPLIRAEADYTKGNRFRDFGALRSMPLVRRGGNMVLSFLVKAATGYWNCFDPTNGFLAIRGDVLAQMELNKIHHSYFFETSMLSQLYLLSARVHDVAIPSRYGTETSNLSVFKVLFEFPPRLLAALIRRLFLRNFIYDFSMESLEILFGLPMLAGGLLYGGISWIRYAELGIGAPTGTVVIPAMLIILGFQLLLSALGSDLQAVPHDPICAGPIRPKGLARHGSKQNRNSRGKLIRR